MGRVWVSCGARERAEQRGSVIIPATILGRIESKGRHTLTVI